MGNDANEAEQRKRAENWLEQPFPDGVAPWNRRIFRQAAVALGIGGVVQNINDVRATDGLRIVDSGVLKPKVFFELFGPLVGDELHVIFAAKLQAARRTRLDARGLESLAHAIGAERALVNLLRHRVEARNLERAARDAKFTANAVFLIEVDDAIGVFDDGTVGRAGGETTWLGAVHALIFAHEPLDGAIGILVLIELDEIPEVVACLRHCLVSVVEECRRERHVVPFNAGNFAGLAPDARSRVDQLADLELALHTAAGTWSGMPGDLLGL